MKPILKISALLAVFASLTSCGIPTAAVRTARNALKEANSISNGTSSAYSDAPVRGSSGGGSSVNVPSGGGVL